MYRLRNVGLWAVVIGCLYLVGCKPQAEQASQPVKESTQTSETTQDTPADEGLIVAMGDSLTAGLGVPEAQAYPAQLEQKLRDNGYPFRVINAGVSGETSSGARTRTEWMLSLKPDIVILETGANDGLRGIDPDLMQENIDAIVKTLRAQQVVVVLAGMQMVRNLGETYIQAFEQVYAQLAQQHDLIFMPFFLEGVGGEVSLNQDDGIHPTAAGYKLVVDNLYPHVTAAIQEFRQKRALRASGSQQ